MSGMYIFLDPLYASRSDRQVIIMPVDYVRSFCFFLSSYVV